MNAIIWFDIAALCLLFILWYILFLRRSVVTGQIVRFRLVLVLITVATVADFFSTVSDNLVYAGISSPLTDVRLMVACSTVYYLAHFLTLVGFVTYISALFKINENARLVHMVYGIPATATMMALLLNLLTGQIFYYDARGVYHRGTHVLLVYLLAGVYIVYAAYLLVRYSGTMQREKRLSLYGMVFFVIASNLIQLFFPELRVENFAVTLDALLVYLFIESPANYIDSQTGLLSAESFYMHFNSVLNNHERMKLLFLSLDDIDEWDREVGKATTDAAIVNVAGYLRTLKGNGETYRMNRNLFIMNLSITEEGAIEDMIEDVREWFSRSIVVGNYKIALANCTMRVDAPEQVLSEMDVLGAVEMMSDVEMHRNRREIRFDDLGIEKHNRTRHVDLELREGIPHRRYRIGFQPIYSMTSRRFSHFDTDVSFIIDGVGEVRFSKVLSIAEQNGSIGEMFAFIVDGVCRRIKEYDFEKRGIHTVNIKLPMTQLLKQEGIDRMVGTIDAYGIPHKMIIFELQEESLENYEGQIRSGIEQLNDKGFKFVLNNYGYGFTNAEILVKMPLTAVTLDNRLTKAGGTDEKADRLLRSTLDLITGLGLRAKAEHIETEAERDYAMALGCELLQGYYYVGLLYDDEIGEFLESPRMEVDSYGK